MNCKYSRDFGFQQACSGGGMMKGKIEWRESNQVCCKRVLLLSSKRKLKRNWILCLSKRSLLAPTGALYVTIGQKHDFFRFSLVAAPWKETALCFHVCIYFQFLKLLWACIQRGHCNVLLII